MRAVGSRAQGTCAASMGHTLQHKQPAGCCCCWCRPTPCPHMSAAAGPLPAVLLPHALLCCIHTPSPLAVHRPAVQPGVPEPPAACHRVPPHRARVSNGSSGGVARLRLPVPRAPGQALMCCCPALPATAAQVPAAQCNRSPQRVSQGPPPLPRHLVRRSQPLRAAIPQSELDRVYDIKYYGALAVLFGFCTLDWCRSINKSLECACAGALLYRLDSAVACCG